MCVVLGIVDWPAFQPLRRGADVDRGVWYRLRECVVLDFLPNLQNAVSVNWSAADVDQVGVCEVTADLSEPHYLHRRS